MECKTPQNIIKWQRFLEQVAGIKDLCLIELIGKGAFGRVFKAKLKNDPTGTIFALKIILADPEDYIPEIKTITRYYSTIYQCCPDCLVTVFPHFFKEGEFSDKKYLVVVSQYVPLTLDKLIGKLQIKDAVSLILKFAECLKLFAGEGLLYTDIKPANLGTFKGFNSCKVIDIGGFKTSKTFSNFVNFLNKSTKSYLVFTPLYAPPEMLTLLSAGQNEINRFVEQELKEGRAYSYSLAALLGVLTDTLEKDPFEGKWIIKDSEIKPILLLALERDRAKRPTLEEFIEILRRFLYSTSLNVSPIEIPKVEKTEGEITTEGSFKRITTEVEKEDIAESKRVIETKARKRKTKNSGTSKKKAKKRKHQRKLLKG